jgi:PHD/YefM family antitoxin component YafN of YafNO toxin-antitoxin module
MGKLREQYIIDENGKKTAVVIPVREYRRLLEDIHDLAVVAERRPEATISLDELKRRLRADGLLQD